MCVYYVFFREIDTHSFSKKKIPTTLSKKIIIEYESTYILGFFLLLNSTCKYIEIDSIFKTFTTILPVLFFFKKNCHYRMSCDVKLMLFIAIFIEKKLGCCCTFSHRAMICCCFTVRY